VGRNHRENERLAAYAIPDDIQLSVVDHPGPLVLLPHGGPPEWVERAAAVCLRYSDAPEKTLQPVLVRQGDREWILATFPCSPQDTDAWLI
jgi:predicted ribosome quality control (RQC) complex YloA/Tae2 family protein